MLKSLLWLLEQNFYVCKKQFCDLKYSWHHHKIYIQSKRMRVHCESSVNEILIKFSCTYLIFFFSVRSLCWKDSFFYVINVQRKKIVDGRGNKWRRYERKVQFFHLIPPHSLKNATKTEREKKAHYWRKKAH